MLGAVVIVLAAKTRVIHGWNSNADLEPDKII